jgi:hypothetical protein
MMKLMLVVGTMVVIAGCAGSTEDSTASLTSAVSAAASSSGSDDANDEHGGGRHRGPPPEAFAACEGKAAGDACTIAHDDQSITGTCLSPPAEAPDTRIVCRPDHMPEGGPPPGGGDCPGHDDQKPEEKPADSAPSAS